MRTKEGNKEKDILEAAIKVFADYGYHNAKVAKIAEVANVATGSVYVYFKNKEDILLKIFENVWSKLYHEAKELNENLNSTPVEKLDDLLDLLFDLFTSSPQLTTVVVNEQNHLQKSSSKEFTNYYEMFFKQGELIIKEGIRKQYFVKNINVGIVRNFIFGGVRYLLNLWAEDNKSFPINKIRQNVKYFVKNGVSI